MMGMENLAKRMYSIEFVLDNYHEWKNEKEEFKKYVHEKAGELIKDRDSNNIPNKWWEIIP